METGLHEELYVTNITVLDSWHKCMLQLQLVNKIFSQGLLGGTPRRDP